MVINHNPSFGTSRNVLAFICATGVEPAVIEYLQTGWTKPPLQGLFAAAGLTTRAALRASKTPAAELGLLEPTVTEDQILDAMVANPVLVNRPTVCTAKCARLCRPSEAVFEMSENPPGELTNEDGEVVKTR